ncbi:Mammalian cell entry related domain protein [Streptomyces albus]|uniref:Mammalian cell entry related domain protein n=1 Tax=Streptomyces albus (strain ATCC 21838 / DSM 41398 / FERM P-419 / JCM 4703 / NBRC 107858) TaxID=1081613 RepID=A0A0B5EZK5_STRA4|nr:Mammalian cell entry related domain protein [Streptomyces albus]AOU81562.1 Mammalian cell entry related domain protein [Streptomyces albus]AYN37255.1 MCE family protein [Streptomyces albus]
MTSPGSTSPGRLRRGWQRIRTEPKLGRHVAVITALAVLASGVGGYILNHQRLSWPWDKSFTFYATFQQAPGVSPGHGQEVRIAGVHVGEIESVGVDDHGDARLKLSIDTEHEVHKNATVVLRPKSQLNEMYVELNPGTREAGRIKSNGVLPVRNSKAPVQIDQVLSHLDTNTRSALTTLLQQSDTALAGAPEQLPEGLNATDKVVKRLKPVVTALQTRRTSLRKLVTALSQVSTAVGDDDGRLTRLINSLEKTLTAVGAHKGDLGSSLSKLPGVTRQLKEATTAVQSLSDQLDPTLDGLDGASDSLPNALKKAKKTADKLDETVDNGNPAVDKALPVVRNLRPFAKDLDAALPDLRASTKRLDEDTAALVPSLVDLGPFLINTRSLTSYRDGNGGILRGFAVVAPTTIPNTDLKFLSTPTQPYRFPLKPVVPR